jgi:hypothetical protein
MKRLNQATLDCQLMGVAEVVLRSLGIFDLDQYQAQLADAQPLEPPVEKKQEPVKRQEQLKQHQKQQVKEREQGMELQGIPNRTDRVFLYSGV